MLSSIGTLAQHAGRSSWRSTLAALVLALILAACAPVAENGPYPIWWSPSLELASLDQIDARLQRNIWPGINVDFELYKGRGDERQTANAANCNELLNLGEQKYWASSSSDRHIQLFHSVICRTIVALRSAKPAKVSHLREFKLDEHAVSFLPALTSLTASCREVCVRVSANDQRQAISEFEKFSNIEVLSENKIELSNDTWWVDLEIVARGEFTGDGMDDLLLLASGGATQGTYGVALLFTLTRDAPISVFYVVDALHYLCNDFNCNR